MKNKQRIVVLIFFIICVVLVIYATIVCISEFVYMTSAKSAKYDIVTDEDISARTLQEKQDFVNTYAMVNTDEFSTNKLYDYLSDAYKEKYSSIEDFTEYVNKNIISNIDLSSDYLNVELVSQYIKNNMNMTEYVVNVYTNAEYIKLFDYESEQKPNVKFKYSVLFIEDSNQNYVIEIW